MSPLYFDIGRVSTRSGLHCNPIDLSILNCSPTLRQDTTKFKKNPQRLLNIEGYDDLCAECVITRDNGEISLFTRAREFIQITSP